MKQLFFFLFGIIATSAFCQQVKQTDTLYLNISVQQADSLIQANTTNPDFIIIDVRTPSEYNGGFIEGAININYYATNFGDIIDTLNRDKMYLVYCGSGSRSAKARDTMISKHFVTVYNMLGGMSSWLAAGYPVTTTTSAEALTSIISEVKVYPNPVTNISTLEFSGYPGSLFKVEIYDLFGRLLKTNLAKNECVISHDEFCNGIYLFHLTGNGNIVLTGNFVVD